MIVEDAETWELLKHLGCELAQGYFLSRPLPADLVTPMLAGEVSLLPRAPLRAP